MSGLIMCASVCVAEECVQDWVFKNCVGTSACLFFLADPSMITLPPNHSLFPVLKQCSWILVVPAVDDNGSSVWNAALGAVDLL